jgi:hypothetical protein
MTEARQRMVRDGLFAGTIAWAVVAVFFAILNLAQGNPAFLTAALLGEALFAGVRDASGVAMDPGLIIAFNGLQLVALLAFGFFSAWLAYEAELHPEAWYLAVFAFLGLTVAGFSALLVVTILLGGLVSAWLALAATLLGAGSVVVYLVVNHQPLARAVRDDAGSGNVALHGG